jgi:integrase/recombinase XerD
MLDERTPIDTVIPISELVAEYLDDCRIRNLSPVTISRYDESLRRLLASHWDSELRSLRVESVRSVVAGLLESHSPATINRELRALKAFLYYALDNDYEVPFHPRKLKKLREPRKVPPCFSAEQIEALLAQPDRRTYAGLRWYTMMCLMLDVGLRLSELTGLETGDINLPYIRVRGKFDKERILAASDVMVKTLRRYLGVRDRLIARTSLITDLVFPSRIGTRLTPTTVNSAIKKYGRQAGITGVRLSPHTFRYTYTSLAIRNGMSLTSLQTCLGHTTLTMTRHYAVLNDSDAFEESRRCSPLVSLGGKRRM